MRSLVILGAVLALVHPALADDATDADALFAQALALKEQGKTEEACKVFEQSLAKNHHAVGTLLNVGLCYANAGKVASAAKLFADARDRATELKSEQHVKAAVAELAKLEGHIPHLVLTFSEPPPPETRVVIDDEMAASTGEKIAIDPGARELVVTAPGRVAYRTTVQVPASGDDVSVVVPRLARPTSTRRTVGKFLVGGGGVMFAASVGIAVYAKHKYDTAVDDHCHQLGDDIKCDPTGYRQTGRAKTLARTATYVGGIGLAAAAVGTYFWLFGKHEAAPGSHGVTIVPLVDDDRAGFAAIGRF